MDTNLIDSTPLTIAETQPMTIERIRFDSGNIPLRNWWATVGSDKVKAVCLKAGITFDYFKHVAAKRRRFGRDVAEVFVKYSGLTLAELMPVKTGPKTAKKAAKRVAKPRQHARG